MEACVESVASAVAAAQGGAARLELCSALSEGGLTPSVGLLKVIKDLVSIPVFVMLRPRAGNFTYSPEEIRSIQIDADALMQAGADGVVFGALTADGAVDEVACSKVISVLPAGTPVTFHRAFDWTADPLTALEDVIKIGFHRILTSGQAATAKEGVNCLQRLINQAEGRIIIMPGCGIDAQNLQFILEKTGASEFHASARSSQPVSVHHNPSCSMGTQDLNVKTTDVRLVEELVQIFKFPSKRIF